MRVHPHIPVRSSWVPTFTCADESKLLPYPPIQTSEFPLSSLTYYGIWPAMIVWGLDRFLRFVRLALLNFGYLKPLASKSSQKELDATVEVLSPHFLRLTLTRSKYFRWQAGQSAYLSFPALSNYPFQSHPFTIGNICTADGSSQKLTFFVRVRSGFTQRLMNSASPEKTFKTFINGPYSSPPLLFGYNAVILVAGLLCNCII